MKTLKSLSLLLLLATGLMAQPSPNDMFIDGYVLDANGQAVANQEVCVTYFNSPLGIQDTICSNTNANGYYTLTVINGSLTGPNVTFDVSTYDPCALLPVVQTVENMQGTVDNVTLAFSICATGSGTCGVSFTASNDSTSGANGLWTFTANPTGTAPFTYNWWVDGASYSTQTVTHNFNGGIVGVYVTVTDADSCQAFSGDTLFLDGNPNQNCSASIVVLEDSSNAVLNAELSAIANGVAPFTYDWSNGETTESIYLEDIVGLDSVCVTITDANGCISTACDVVGFEPITNCLVEITTVIDSTPNGVFYTLTASGGFASYDWLNNQTGQSITVQNISPNGEVYCVVATTSNGCIATACDTLLPINSGNCFADFFYLEDANGNLVVEDTVIVNYAGSPSNTNYYFWTVEYGGQVWNSFEQNLIVPVPPTLVPVGGIDVEVCLTVTDSLTSCSDTYCETVTLVQPNAQSCSGNIVTNIDSSGNYILAASGTGQPPFTYNWFTGETTQTVVFDPSNILWSGVVCVNITDANGCSAYVCDTLMPNVPNCSANFLWQESNILGTPLPAVEFSDQSQNAASWFWDFGDNTSSTDQNPLHVYNTAGTYGVCLTIVNADQSCQQTFCDTIVVGNTGSGNCDATFTNSGQTPIGYTFSANIQNSNLDYIWTINNQYVGDGFEAYSPGFTNGVHTVCLTVIDSLSGCSDTQCQTITVGSNNCFGYISGQLYAGSNNQPLDEGVVYLITFDPNSNQLTAVDSMVVDSGNYYFFGPLACGDYLIKAAAYPGSQYYSNHVPTYYGTSPFWSFAQSVTLGQVNAQVTADVFLISANNPGGPGFIGGDVSQGANKVDPGDPLEGMQVMLFDLSGNAIAYTYTDGNGEFGFSNLAYGTYQVYVEQLGVETDPAYVTIGPDKPSVDDLHIFASETLITTGINDFDFNGAISEVYPNPVGADASVNFNLETEVMVNINVLDLAGRTISTATRSISSGENQVRFDVDGLTEGYYFLNIQDLDGAFSVTRKFMRVD